jgi:hypothetical protein
MPPPPTSSPLRTNEEHSCATVYTLRVNLRPSRATAAALCASKENLKRKVRSIGLRRSPTSLARCKPSRATLNPSRANKPRRAQGCGACHCKVVGFVGEGLGVWCRSLRAACDGPKVPHRIGKARVRRFGACTRINGHCPLMATVDASRLKKRSLILALLQKIVPDTFPGSRQWRGGAGNARPNNFLTLNLFCSYFLNYG